MLMQMIFTIATILTIIIVLIDFTIRKKWQYYYKLILSRAPAPEIIKPFTPAPELCREVKPINPESTRPGRYLVEQFNGSHWLVCIVEAGKVKPYSTKQYKTIESVGQAIRSILKNDHSFTAPNFWRDTDKLL
jgi:hypothetical protein